MVIEVALEAGVEGKAFKGRTERAMAAGRVGWDRCSGGYMMKRVRNILGGSKSISLTIAMSSFLNPSQNPLSTRYSIGSPPCLPATFHLTKELGSLRILVISRKRGAWEVLQVGEKVSLGRRSRSERAKDDLQRLVRSLGEEDVGHLTDEDAPTFRGSAVQREEQRRLVCKRQRRKVA